VCDGNEEGRKRGAVDQESPENSELKCKDKDPTLPNTKFYFVGFLEAILKVCVKHKCSLVGLGWACRKYSIQGVYTCIS